MSKVEICALIEGSRPSFEEKVYIKYFLYCEKENIKAMDRKEFLALNADDSYKDDYIQSLWQGWQWCYEICKVPTK